MHYDIDYLSCVDVLGVMDFPYINNNEIRTTSLAGICFFLFCNCSGESFSLCCQCSYHGSVD